MKKNKIFSFVLIVLLCFGLFTSCNPEPSQKNYLFEINDVKYETLQEAVDSLKTAKSNSVPKIKLLKDAEGEGCTVDFTVSFDIDFGSYNYVFTGTKGIELSNMAFVDVYGGNLSVSENATLNSLFVVDESCILNTNYTSMKAKRYVKVFKGNSSVISINNCDTTGAIELNNASAYIDGGKIILYSYKSTDSNITFYNQVNLEIPNRNAQATFDAIKDSLDEDVIITVPETVHNHTWGQSVISDKTYGFLPGFTYNVCSDCGAIYNFKLIPSEVGAAGTGNDLSVKHLRTMNSIFESSMDSINPLVQKVIPFIISLLSSENPIESIAITGNLEGTSEKTYSFDNYVINGGSYKLKDNKFIFNTVINDLNACVEADFVNNIIKYTLGNKSYENKLIGTYSYYYDEEKEAIENLLEKTMALVILNSSFEDVKVNLTAVISGQSLSLDLKLDSLDITCSDLGVVNACLSNFSASVKAFGTTIEVKCADDITFTYSPILNGKSYSLELLKPIEVGVSFEDLSLSVSLSGGCYYYTGILEGENVKLIALSEITPVVLLKAGTDKIEVGLNADVSIVNREHEFNCNNSYVKINDEKVDWDQIVHYMYMQFNNVFGNF